MGEEGYCGLTPGGSRETGPEPPYENVRATVPKYRRPDALRPHEAIPHKEPRGRRGSAPAAAPQLTTTAGRR
ncbi:hypothetical protein GCM10010330_15890 [Streptomyces tendae]|nr:hypothetical protein GCM10010330_15890 [Streptomyces tendae]